MKRDKLKEQDVIIGTILTGVSTIIYFMIRFSELHDMTHAKTGLSPAFFPELSFFFMIIMSVILLISSLVMRPEEDKKEKVKKLDRTQIRQVGIILLILMVYIHLIDVLGYYISSYFTGIIVMLNLKVRSWYKIVLINTILMVLVFLFFEKGLRILLPRGILF